MTVSREGAQKQISAKEHLMGRAYEVIKGNYAFVATFQMSHAPSLRRIALKQKTMAMIYHDRYVNELAHLGVKGF